MTDEMYGKVDKTFPVHFNSSEMPFCECWTQFGTTWQQAKITSHVHTGYRKTGLVWKCGTPAALSTPSCLLLVVLSSSPGISKPQRGPSPFRIAASLHPSLVPTCNTSIGKQLYFSWNLYPVWGRALAQLVEAMHYKPEGRKFDSRWCHRNLSLT